MAYTGGQVTFPFVPLGIALIAAGVVALFLIRRRRQSADDRR
ncbi:LPXTG cell wall anchor domain-containing protein [Microbacterium testaceum]